MGFGLHDDRDERSYGSRGGGRAHPYARGGGGGGGGGAVSGNRVFIHNLSFKTSWQDLKDHARQASAPIAAQRRAAAKP
jgi:arginine/serine-rich splicing factor 4/5/6